MIEAAKTKFPEQEFPTRNSNGDLITAIKRNAKVRYLLQKKARSRRMLDSCIQIML